MSFSKELNTLVTPVRTTKLLSRNLNYNSTVNPSSNLMFELVHLQISNLSSFHFIRHYYENHCYFLLPALNNMLKFRE